MPIRAYKFWNVSLGIIIVVLGVEALYLLLVVAKLQATEIHTEKAVRGFVEAQEAACQSTPAKAVKELQFLLDSRHVDYGSNAAQLFIINHCRAQAVSNVLSCLRRMTGEDLGGDPHVWIQKYQKR